MAEESLQTIKAEATFFMEKSFQFSFVYVGSIFAGIASSKLDVVDQLAGRLHTSTTVIVASSLLFLNFTYLLLASSCLFAVLKRGLFILEHGAGAEPPSLWQWEEFVRGHPFSPRIGWNVDNYYMGFVYLMVYILSAGAVAAAWQDAHGWGLVAILFPAVLHLATFWALGQTIKLSARCHKALSKGAVRQQP